MASSPSRLAVMGLTGLNWIRANRWTLLGLSMYLVIALWLTWPIVLSPLSDIPIGSEPVASVPLYNIWAIWWNADRLASGLLNYWDAPIFFPTPNAFALSEPQPVTMVVAPFLWITGSRVLAYNLYAWLSLVLNGFFAQRLLRVYGLNRWTALWGGAVMSLLPIVSWQLGILQLVPLWGILWTWGAIEKVCRKPTRWRGIELGAAMGISLVLCFYHGLFLAILLVAAAPTLWRQLIQWRDWPVWLLAVLVAVIIVAPFAYQMRTSVGQHGTEWGRDLVTNLSARPVDYLAAYGGQLIQIKPDTYEWMMLSPGCLKMVLAMAGIFFGLRHGDSRRWSSFLLVIGVLAFLLSMGPKLQLGGWHPWWSLSQFVPGVESARTVYRFAFFVQMVVALFAAVGLQRLYQAARSRVPQRHAKLALRSLFVLFALIVVFEVRLPSSRSATVPDVKQHEVWLDYVREHTPAGHGIACFPFPIGPKVVQYVQTAEWMYLGTFHEIPLVNGLSTHYPEHYLRIRQKILKRFPTPEILEELRQQGVEFLVLRRSPDQRAATEKKTMAVGDYRLSLVCEDVHVHVFHFELSQ